MMAKYFAAFAVNCVKLCCCFFSSKFPFHAIWIGANDRLFEGDYMWTDRSAITFHNWFPGWPHANESITHSIRQPSDDGYSDEDCVEIRRLFSYPGKGTGQTSSFFWNDRNCEEKNPFICQYDKHISKRSIDHVPLQCDKLLQLTDDTPNVILTSPDYPQTYPALASCHTIVTAPAGKQLHIDFLHFDIEDGKQ
ncbi:uncharacterized protein LOC123550625 [Mercenaria mercenaria]|uniref:uncharacterized protein LOC123550625 n=1 Tax=Mercenaria mercenaria TaxID=6596 RepID=UPI00234E6AAF|nr:uncharacterized protein LOC123550625 [Mercenaria mercenaria]